MPLLLLGALLLPTPLPPPVSVFNRWLPDNVQQNNAAALDHEVLCVPLLLDMGGSRLFELGLLPLGQ